MLTVVMIVLLAVFFGLFGGLVSFADGVIASRRGAEPARESRR